jgi:hypothetical protein
MRERRNVRKIIDGNSKWVRPFGTPRNKWEDMSDIEMGNRLWDCIL